MQILFVHPNFPAQFGPMLGRLVQREGVECVFVHKGRAGMRGGVRCIRYRQAGGATRHTHHCSRTFENAVWNAHAVYEACKATPDLRPDLIVGHSGFGTTLFLQELYACPIVSHFEYYYRPHDSDMDFRPEFPSREIDVLRSHARNAMIHLDFEACTAGYTPTHWQHGLFPESWQPKLEVIHDGVDTGFWRPRDVERRLGGERVDEGVRIVTFVARGLEAMRGFDIFVRMANRIACEMPNVVFAVVGSDRTHYGGELRHIPEKTFREHVLLAEKPDLGRFRFLGAIPPKALASLLSVSDLHIYLTVPFVLSWSLLDALACGATVVASDTAPVREVIQHERTGLLADFSDVEGLAEQALRVLKDPAAFRPLGETGRRTIEERYSVDQTFPRHWDLFSRAIG